MRTIFIAFTLLTFNIKTHAQHEIIQVKETPDPNKAHIIVGNPSATNSQPSSMISFAGWGIQHAGFVWIPDGTSDGKLNLSFGGQDNGDLNPVKYTFKANGNFGIGTDFPLKKLHIRNNSSYEAGIIETPNLAGSNLRFKDNTGEAIEMGIQNGDAVIRTNNSIRFIAKTGSGNIGIGTPNPGNWKLAVNGNIKAKEIKVETGWSDFVFYDHYKLPTLNEVENYIIKNGHLKDIPSEKDVAKNGILLGEMDSKLLQKIEELTLYTIQQEKKIKELELLNTKLLEIQKRLEDLEKK